MGADKYENEGLFEWGQTRDVWFHVDGLSSAHVYLRLPLAAAQDALRDASWARRAPAPPPSQSYVVSTPVDMPRCDSNTASTDGLASMIRHDSLNDLTDLDRHVHDGSPLSFSEYQTSETRRRIAPATPSPPCAVRSAA